MKDKNIEQLKKNYMDVPIPNELDIVVKKALEGGGVKMIQKKGRMLKRISTAVASIAASVVLLTVVVNVSPAIAKTASEVPIVGGVVKALTFREYTVKEDTFNAKIEVPEISGLENKNLENSLNEKYLEEDKQLYEQFKADMEDIKESNGGPGGHLGINSGYNVKTDNDRILSIERYVVSTSNGMSTREYDTIDKKNEVLITLPSLFKDDRYVDIISENIKQQMIDQMKSDPKKSYDIEVPGKEKPFRTFEKISGEQKFYINSDGKLVIVFEKYEVAPGYMGTVEFIIPTEVISDVLVGHEYIR